MGCLKPQVCLWHDSTGFACGYVDFFEVTLFAAVALFVAPLGAVVVASHQIAINFSSLAFMMPLSVGIAISIRVGYYQGHQQPKKAFQSIYAALAVGHLCLLPVQH